MCWHELLYCLCVFWVVATRNRDWRLKFKIFFSLCSWGTNLLFSHDQHPEWFLRGLATELEVSNNLPRPREQTLESAVPPNSKHAACWGATFILSDDSEAYATSTAFYFLISNYYRNKYAPEACISEVLWHLIYCSRNLWCSKENGKS